MAKKLKNKKHSFDNYYSFWDSYKNYFIIVSEAKEVIMTKPKGYTAFKYDKFKSIEDFLHHHFNTKLELVLTKNDISYLRESEE